MTAVYDIIEELNASNSSNHKIATLKKYKDNDLFRRLLKMTYDKVEYRYYLTMNYWHKKQEAFPVVDAPSYKLEQALDFLENILAERVMTGNDAIEALDKIFRAMETKERDILIKVINRDLRINCGRTQINKVFGDLITKPVYMRCGVFSQKTAKDISFPAFIQLKADGTYREMQVSNGKVEFLSRSGEQYEYTFGDLFTDLPDGHYTGEMIVDGTQNRAESNGLLNSDNPPMDRIKYFLWDYITPEEYTNAARKIKNTTKYSKRLRQLSEILSQVNYPQLQMIESHLVNNIQEAFEKVTVWMNQGLEGGILKDANGVYRDGTSKHQLKMKKTFSVDVRVTGFLEGTIGTVREKTFGAITFETDDGNIRGSTSGFTQSQLQHIHNNREKYIGCVMEVQGNDLTRSSGNDYYAISHPRFIEFRLDKDNTDTIERAIESCRLAASFT